MNGCKSIAKLPDKFLFSSATMIRSALLGLLTLGLIACSGGGSGGSGEGAITNDPPALSLTPRPVKNFSFGWASVSAVTEYRIFENPDGMSGYTQVAAIDAARTSHDLEVFLPSHINASFILEACNSQGCSESEPVFVSGTLAEAIGYVKASNTGSGDQFSVSLALSSDGNTLAVGAIAEASNATGINGDQTDNSASGSGAVYIFTRSSDNWSQQAYLKAPNTEANDNFGLSVALSSDGSTLAVGAANEASKATGINGDQTDNSASASGAVYVFARGNAIWSQQAYLKASNTGAGDNFGGRVSLATDGNTLAVGAIAEASNATGIDGEQSSNSAPISGAVYIFSRSDTGWSQQAYIKASNTGDFERFGGAVTLGDNGNTLAVGAYFENSNALISGAVYVFTRSVVTWSQQAYLKASNADSNDRFGAAVALTDDGNTLAVGALFESSDAIGIDGGENNNDTPKSGAVYLFNRSGGSWLQQAYLKAPNTETDDYFGFSLDIAGDGNVIAVGAYSEDSSATSINGDQTDNSLVDSGAVYLY